MDVAAIVVAALSSGVLSILISQVIGHISRRSSIKVEHSKKKMKLYSPIVQLITSINLQSNDLLGTIGQIESNLNKEYDYVALYINEKLSKVKVMALKREISDFADEGFFKLCLSIQREYNLAKKSASMDYDIRYTDTDTDISSFSRYFNVLIGIYAAASILSLIYILATGGNNFSIVIALGVMALATAIMMGIIFVIYAKIVHRVLFHRWKKSLQNSMVAKDEKSNEEGGGENAKSKAHHH